MRVLHINWARITFEKKKDIEKREKDDICSSNNNNKNPKPHVFAKLSLKRQTDRQTKKPRGAALGRLS